jgi:hypothetical protein
MQKLPGSSTSASAQHIVQLSQQQLDQQQLDQTPKLPLPLNVLQSNCEQRARPTRKLLHS